MRSLTKRPVRDVRVASLQAIVDRRENGVIYVRSPQPLGEYPARVTDRLEFWATRAPSRIFLAKRAPDGNWHMVTYAETLVRVRRLARGLLDRGLSANRPLMILSGNSIEHGLLALAAMYAGIPYAPIAPAYSLAVKEFTALSYVWQNFGPAMVFADEPPVLCDWLPWNHTFGGSHNFGIALYNGGSLYIDAGKPTPDLFGETLRNLREVAPTAYFNVPKGYEMLLGHLQTDPGLRKTFFSRLNLLFFAAAGLSQHIWDALQDLAFETCGEEILVVTG